MRASKSVYAAAAAMLLSACASGSSVRPLEPASPLLEYPTYNAILTEYLPTQATFSRNANLLDGSTHREDRTAAVSFAACTLVVRTTVLTTPVKSTLPLQHVQTSEWATTVPLEAVDADSIGVVPLSALSGLNVTYETDVWTVVIPRVREDGRTANNRREASTQTFALTTGDLPGSDGQTVSLSLLLPDETAAHRIGHALKAAVSDCKRAGNENRTYADRPS